MQKGEWTDPDAGKMLFSVYFEEHWIGNRVGETNTIESYWSHYRSTLKPYFGHLELRKITRAVVQRWVVAMEKEGVTPGTLRAKHRSLSTILGGKKGVSAVGDGLISKSPCEGIALPHVDRREVKVYSVTEVDRLLAELGAWWLPLPMVAAETGLRWGELMGLMVKDFSEDATMIQVRRTIVEASMKSSGAASPFLDKPRPKSGRARTLGVSPEMGTFIQSLIKGRQLFPGDRLFSMHDGHGMPLRTYEWPQGRPVHRSVFRQGVWLPAHERLGIEPRRFHDLRGSHISWLLAGGADVATVMERVGHTQLSTTQSYVAALGSSNQRALSALDNVRRAERG